MQICRLIGLALTLPLVCLALDESTTAWAESEPDSNRDKPIDEVVAAGTKSLATLEAEALAAEDRFYEEYNRLNDDDDYDMVCQKEAQPGTQIKTRNCRPKIVNDLIAENSQKFLIGEDGTVSLGHIEHHQDLALKKLEALVQEHPSLTQALVEFYTKKKIYQSEHDRRCDAKTLICSD